MPSTFIFIYITADEACDVVLLSCRYKFCLINHKKIILSDLALNIPSVATVKKLAMSWRYDTTTTSWCVLSSITLKYSYSHLWVCLFTLRVVPSMILVLLYHTSLNETCCCSAVGLSHPFLYDVMIRYSKPVSSAAVSLANAEKKISEMINYSLNSQTTNWKQVSVQFHADKPALIKKTKKTTKHNKKINHKNQRKRSSAWTHLCTTLLFSLSIFQ